MKTSSRSITKPWLIRNGRKRKMPRLDSDSIDARSEDHEGAIRLQRYLAMAGAGSRRHCEEFILAGRVTVDRQTVRELGFRVIPGAQDVRLDGERVRVERK